MFVDEADLLCPQGFPRNDGRLVLLEFLLLICESLFDCSSVGLVHLLLHLGLHGVEVVLGVVGLHLGAD